MSTVTVTWTEQDIGGGGLNGTVRFVLSSAVSVGGVTTEPVPQIDPIVNSAGQTTPAILANDTAGLLPANSYYTVTVVIPGIPPEPFTVQVLAANGASQTLAFLRSQQVFPSAPPSGPFLPLPSGTPVAGDVAAVVIDGSPATAWGPQTGGGGGSVASVFGRTGAVVATSGDYGVAQVTGAAPLASPALTGTPTAPTKTALTSSTALATTAYADAAVSAEAARAAAAEALLAPKASPVLTGAPALAAATATSLAASTFVQGNRVLATGLTGATATSRWVGATTGGAPVTGTFSTGDFITDVTGAVWVCTAGGTPGTWAQAGAGSFLAQTGGALTGPLSVAGALTTVPVTLTDAASITISAAASNAFRVTLGGNRTLANPTSPTDEQPILIEVIQDGTGSRTLAYGSAYFFPASIGTPVLSTAAGAHDFLVFRYNAAATTWYCTGFIPQQAAATVATVAQGGTGLATLTAWALLAGGTTSTGALQQIGVGTSTQVLTSNGPGALPSFQAAASGFANPMTTLGDLISGGAAGAAARLVGDTSNTRKFLRSLSSAGTATAPVWDTLLAADLPTGTTSAQGALQLDGTATDITTVGTTAAAGAIGKPADAGHVHASPVPIPADFSSVVAWTLDPASVNASDLLVSGTVYLMSFFLRSVVASIGHIGAHVITAGSGLTAGDSLAGIYGPTGTLLGQTADQSAVWTTAGAYNMALASAITNAAVGKYWVAFLSVGTTPPTFRAGSSTGILANIGLSGAGLRCAINGTGQTSLPGSLTLASNVAAGSFPFGAVIGT